MPRYDWLFSMAAAALCACVGTGNDRRTASGDVDLAGATRRAVLADAIVERADSLIRAGRPGRATLVLTPLLVTPNTASPEARLVGARAAAAWDGWSEVQRLLLGAPWLDPPPGGAGPEPGPRGLAESGGKTVSHPPPALGRAARRAPQPSRAGLPAPRA